MSLQGFEKHFKTRGALKAIQEPVYPILTLCLVANIAATVTVLHKTVMAGKSYEVQRFSRKGRIRTMEGMRRCLPLLLLWILASTGLYADAPAFDLSGPKVDVHVKRGEITLPISQVPSLQPGDRLWVHPDLPESQSAHYVLIVAFLRGATNPPPPEWFTRVETWNSKVRDEGVFVTVPAEAQQALLFLAPETGGDFSTLRAAVRGRPGAFVRAGQDLQAASLDRMRLDAYLAEMRGNLPTDPKELKERTEMLARSLGIKVDQQCFDKPTDQQAPCLVQHTDGLVLDDANTQSMVTQLANGAAGDLMNQLSYSTLVGAGQFSPYVGAILDTARILSSLHTAHFQYIPALALPTKDTLNLRLNVPPSFRDPKSVVVVALPPIAPAKLPPLHPVNPEEVFCAQKPKLVLPAEGAPAVFSTQMAYELVLRVTGERDGKAASVEIPVKTDPAHGGLVPEGAVPPLPEGELTAVVHGKWGFDDWEGPHYQLHAAQPGKWTVATADQSALVVGREDQLHLDGDSSVCVDHVDEVVAGKSTKLTWKSAKPEILDVSMPMKEAQPGPLTLAIYQYGLKDPQRVALLAYAEAAALDLMTLNAGDAVATLRGTRLDEVAKAELSGIALTPAKLTRVDDADELAMHASASTANLVPGKEYTAKVQLQDGRTQKVPVTVAPPRPQITLLNKGVQDAAPAMTSAAAPAAPSPVRLGSPDDLPVDGRLVFFVKSRVPADFPRDEKLEVAGADGSFHTMLSLSDSTLMLEDAKTAMGTVEPLARFGGSAFGPLQARAVSADGVSGDWLPLGTLVRLPGFKDLRCPRAVAKPCTLSGSNLFLATAIGPTADLNNSTDIPPDFTGTQLSVPHPTNGTLYIKLRDDPATVQTLTLPVTPAGPAAAGLATAGSAPASLKPAAAAQPEPAAPADDAPAGADAAPAPADAAPAVQPQTTEPGPASQPNAPPGR